MNAFGTPQAPLPPVRSLRVAAAQLNSGPSIERNLERIAAAIKAARRRRAEALLLPECAVTGYATDFSRLSKKGLLTALRQLGAWATDYRLAILVGTPLFLGRRLFNCLLVFDASGRPGHVYAKCQLTPGDAVVFTPGDAVSFFRLGKVACTSIICHERRYPELVRLPVMMGARVLFHPNAGLDALAVSRAKRGGRDGAVARAFENAIFYVFANTVGPQGKGKWSAGDTKIVAPDTTRLAWAGNQEEGVIAATLDLAQATGKYAQDSRRNPRFLAAHWRRMVHASRLRAQAASNELLGALTPTPLPRAS